MKKALATLLAFAMIVTGFLCLNPNASEVKAATTTSDHGTFKAVSMTEWKDENKDGVPEYDGYLFAGYYKNENCAKANRATKENATHMKFVSDDMLDVKAQVTNGAVSASDVEAYEGKYVIRFVSSVESLNYKNIGFELEYEDENGKVVKLRNTTSKVFTRIESTTGAANGEIDEYQFSPKVVGEDSEYFMTAKLPVNNTDEDKAVTYKVRAFWTTFDGTEVMGKTRCVAVNDGDNDIVNMVAEAGTQLEVGTDYTATYGPNADGTGASAVKVEVLSSDANGHTNIRVTLANGATATGLKSATKFIIKDTEGNQVATAVYRNYYTDKAGTADTSWWDVNPTATRFEIASVSDLYGFASIVNGKKDLFYQNEIHLVRDVEVNKGLAIPASETSDGVAKWTGETVAWTPIGSGWNADFRGIFDGDDNTISGLYMSGGSSFVGLFGYAGINNGQNAEIANVRLTNSYFSTSYDNVGSIISYGYGVQRLENVYSDAVLVASTTSGNVGGLVGRLSIPDKAIKSGDDKATLDGPHMLYKNCWFDGEINSSSTGAVNIGGIMGALNNTYRLDMINCLYTGRINNASTSAYVGGLFSRNVNAMWMELTNCLTTGEFNVATNAKGGLFATAQHPTLGWLEMSNCYTSATKAWNSNGFSDYSAEDCQKTEAQLATADVNTLFPGNNGAWVNNVDDAQTPILSTFADWWKEEQYKAGLDTSWYDPDATEYVITTASQLRGLSELSQTNNFAGKTIKLGADIAMNKADSAIVKKWAKGTAIPENSWTPICRTNEFAGTFDGQGYTVSGLYYKGELWNMGLIGSTAEGAVIKNVKVVDSYIKSTGGYVGGIVGLNKATTLENLYSNAIVDCTYGQGGGIVGCQYGAKGGSTDDYFTNGTGTKWNIKNVWFDGEVVSYSGKNYYGGIVGCLPNQIILVVDNALFTGKITGTGANLVGGIIGGNNNASTVTLNNCLALGSIQDGAGSAAALYGKVNSSYTKLFVNHSYTTITNYNTIASPYNYGSLTTSEGLVILQTRDALISANEDTLLPMLEGETENAWVNDIGYNDTDRGTPILASFAEWWIARGGHDEITADYSWYNDNDTEFILYDAADLRGLAYIANNKDDFTGKTVKLGDDIQINEVNADILASWKSGTVVPEDNWTPIGTDAKRFNGTFDGQGHEISGLYLSATTEGAGLFGYTGVDSQFKNFKFVDSHMTSTSNCLGMIGVGRFVNIENIYTNVTIKGSGNLIGGFVGVMYNIKGDYAALYSNIRNCWFDGTITQTDGSKYGMGGFIGGTGGAAALGFHNCLSTGTITGGFRVGGFYGWKNYYATLEAHNCLSVANVSTNVATNYEEFKDLVGSYFGDYSSNAYNVNFYNSYGLSGNRMNGGTTAAYATKLETDTFKKNRAYLIDTDETALFPLLSGETENAWVNDIGYNAVNRGTPILASFAEWWMARQTDTDLNDRADTSWYNDNDTEFVLTTQGQLYGLSQLGQTNTFAGKTIKLGKNIALNKVNATTVETWKNGEQPAGQWKPLVGFAGTFDGQGYTISGLYLNATTASAGMFGTTTATAVIKNFQLVDSYMKSTGKGLGIVGTGTFASMENIYTSAVMVSTSTDVAGFAGNVATNGGTVLFDNCWFDGEIIHTGDYLVGGFVGEDVGATVITFNNCLSTGKITGTSKVGGFMGWANNYAVKTFNNCLSVGEYVATETDGYCGALLGQLNTSSYNFTTTNVYGVGTAFNGAYSGKGASDGSKYENATFLKTRDYICATGVETLFAGSTAWANDNENGWNDTDRGTPILTSFKDFWLKRQAEPTYTVDLSWYNTTDKDFTLNDVADMRGFVYLANNKDDFAGKTVKLGKDIVLNTPNVEAWKEGTETPANTWIPIGTSAKPFAGTFDGQGHTISGLYLNTTASYAGVFGKVAYPGVIRNFKLADSYMKTTGDGLGVIGEGSPRLVDSIYSDAVMEGGSAQGGIIGCFSGVYSPYDAATADNWAKHQVINNCWFDGDITATSGKNSIGGIIGSVSNYAYYEITNCLYTGSISGASDNVGGMLGFSNWASKFDVKDSLFIGSVSMSGGSNHGAMIGKAKAYFMNFYDVHTVGTTIAGAGTTAGIITAATALAKDRKDIVDAGVLLFPTSTAWVNDIGYNDSDRGTPMLASFAQWWMEQNPAEGLQSRPDVSWYDADETEFTLTTADQLYGFAQLAKITTFEGKTVKLGANIALNEVDETILGKWQEGSAVGRQWTPIGTASSKFTGTFNGQSYEISGLYHKSTGANVGLFGTVAHGSVIRNFKLIDSYIYGNGNVGIVGTGLASTIEKIYTNAIIESTANNAGGIIGGSVGHYTDKTVAANENWAQGIMVINECWFDGQINMLGSAYSGGGILGAPGQRSRIDFNNCLYTGTITSERTDVYTRLGGFIGWENSSAQYNFTNCLSVGNYEATDTSYVGGFIGNIGGDGASFTNCYTSYPSANASRVGIGTGTNTITYTNTSEKTRVELNLAEVATLFAGSTAWVKDAGYNAIDRGTPILETFSEWWIGRQDEGALEASPSTAWFSEPVEGAYVIQNKADLLGFLSLAKQGETFDGKTIKLGANITLNTPKVDDWKAGENLPAYQWTPVTFKGNFDGQGHSISGVYLKSGATYVGFFGQTAAGSTISNFRLLDSYVEQTAGEWSRFNGAVVGDACGNISNVYSNAMIVSACNYVGGIAGRVQASKGTNGEITISNCWFNGTIELADGIGYTGGIVGQQLDGKLYLTNVLYTGHIKGKHTGNAFTGGIMGMTANTVTGTELESVVSAGTFDVQTNTGTKYVSSVVGYFYSGTAEKTADYTLNNVFANRGWGTPFSWGGGNGTLTGKVIQTSNSDRLLGYVPQSIAGMDTAQKLDFTTNKTWTMRTNDVPVLTVFKDLVDVRDIVAVDSLTAANLTSELGLGTINGSFANAVADGAGDYVVRVTGSETNYNNYLAQLASLGFTKFVDNAGTTMATDGIYAATYCKAATSNKGEWVVNVTYVKNDGKIYVSINSDVESVANTLLNDDTKNPLGKEDGTNAISLSMIEDKANLLITGNCFVFQLPNGHFIINDGNTNDGGGAILKAYLESIVGEGNPIYVDAWVITHFHNDHGGALMDMANNASLRENLYVDAFYVNEASMYAQTTYTAGGDAYKHTYSILDGARKLQCSEGNSASPVVYQVHMGQRYYLNGITLDVVNTPEQLADTTYSGSGQGAVPDGFNTTSVNIVYTLQDTGKRVLIGGDTTQVMMTYMMNAYGKNSSGYGTSQTLANINAFAAYHHGKNVMNTYYEGTHITKNGVKMHVTSEGNNKWADYLLKNTNNASGFKFDVMFFPNFKQYQAAVDPSTACGYIGGCDGRVVGDDGSTVYPYNATELNQYYANNSVLHFTTGYQDSTSATADDRHGTVKINFNEGGSITYEAYASVHGQTEPYTFEKFVPVSGNGIILPEEDENL